MKVFISWSGEKSCKVGEILKLFLESVIQDLEIFFSPDMEKGSIWNDKVNKELSTASVGIICITDDNFGKPWIQFEAGALAKGLSDSRVITLLVDVNTLDLMDTPLQQFNHTLVERGQIKTMIETINNQLEKPLPERVLDRSFDKFWPDFEESMKEIAGSKQKSKTGSYTAFASEALEMMRKVENALTIENESLAQKVRKMEYRIDKLYALEFEKHHLSDQRKKMISPILPDSSTMKLWITYEDDFEDHIAIAANEIAAKMDISLKDDLALFDCDDANEHGFSGEKAIGYVFLRDNCIGKKEYHSITKAVWETFQKFKIRGGGIRCTGTHIDK